MIIYMAAVLYNRWRGAPSTPEDHYRDECEVKYCKHLNDHEQGLVDSCQNTLESYYYLCSAGRMEYNEPYFLDSGFFLDSGAFSADAAGEAVVSTPEQRQLAKAQGRKIGVSLDDYAAFYRQHSHLVRRVDGTPLVANLDHIGTDAAIDTSSTEGARRASADESFRNQMRMEELVGEQVMPVIHFGERMSALEYYAERYSYIGLGGTRHGQFQRQGEQRSMARRVLEDTHEFEGRAAQTRSRIRHRFARRHRALPVGVRRFDLVDSSGQDGKHISQQRRRIVLAHGLDEQRDEHSERTRTALPVDASRREERDRASSRRDGLEHGARHASVGLEVSVQHGIVHALQRVRELDPAQIRRRTRGTMVKTSFETPLYSVRVRSSPKGMWYVEQFRACDCPDCDKHGHWLVDSVHFDQKDAEDRADRMWRPA